MRESPRNLRCAIYTRKSSEEGLEQDFNSLHAQREACEAYVISQKHEGWKAIPALYDDGGYSGGTMERPGLAQLLADIASGLIDVVVVYKVDRLTRSLTDFARIVDVFDQKSVSFVSVTQSFNTTSSMGRLTLNVLLSFAQFEREVTGERIRDKIAASKKKGLWMGGFVPIGYEADGRTLSINDNEAKTIRLIYDLYLELKSVDAVAVALAERGLQTKSRVGKGGVSGGKSFSRGHLYRILQNPLYAGRISHKGQVYDGQHPAIIDPHLWQQVQDLLSENCQGERLKVRARNPSLLTGLLVDASGQPLLASHAVKRGRRYRYYVSVRLMKRPTSNNEPYASINGKSVRDGWRIPAGEIDGGVIRILTGLLRNEGWVLAHMVAQESAIAVRQAALARAETFAAHLQSSDPVARGTFVLGLLEQVMLTDAEISLTIKTDLFTEFAGSREAPIIETCPFALARRGAETRLILEGNAAREPEPDPVLIKGLAQAHRWWKDLLAQRYATMREIAQAYQTDERYVARIVMLVFLPTTLTQQILDGTHPPNFTLHSFLKNDQPWLAWPLA